MATTRARIQLSAQDATAPAFASLKQRLGAAKGEIDGLTRGFGAITAGFTGLLGGLGITAFVKNVTDGLGALKDLSEATGASIENLSGLEDIAARTGTSFETVGAALLKFNQALVNSGTDKRIADTFKSLGLSIEDLKKQDPAQAFLATTRALDQFAEGGGRARAELILFSRSLREIAPLLRDAAEAGELNATVTQRQVDEADKFSKQLSRLSKEATDAARDIAGPLVSSLNDFFDVLARARQNPAGFLAGIGEQFNVDFLRARLQATNDEIQRLSASAAAAQELLQRQPDSIRAKATLAEFAQLNRAADEYRQKIDQILYADGQRRPANEGGGRIVKPQLPEPKPTPTAPRAQADPIQALIDSTTAARTEKLIGLRKRLDAQFAAGKRSAVDYARGIEAIDAALLALQPKTVAATDTLGQFIEKIESARAAEVAGIVSQSTGARYEAIALQAKLLAEAFEEGAISVVDFARGAEVLGAQFEALAPRVEQVTQQVSTFAEQAARNIQDSLGSTLLSVLDGNFKSIGQLWSQTIKRMIAEAAAAQLGQYLFGAAFASTGTLGGALGSLFGGARATGGPVSAGRAYLVGEKGPELMVPRQAGTVLPNGAAVGGGPVFAPVLHVNGDVSPQTIAAIRAEIGRWHARYMRNSQLQGAT